MAIRIVEINVGVSGASGYSGQAGGLSGFSGYSGESGFSGGTGAPGAGTSGFSGFSGAGESGFSGYSGPGGGQSGFSGFSGPSGFSGFSGGAGSAGVSGFSGFSGAGTSGFSGFSGPSGYTGFTGVSGYTGFSGVGTSGFSGFSGVSGYTGFSGPSGYTGFSGPSGYTGFSGPSGYTGFSGVSGYSGFTGKSGFTGFSGFSGISGYTGYTGFSGPSGYTGFSGPSGYTGFSGPSGYTGFTGVSGYSGFSGVSGYTGYTGFSGPSGYTGFSGPSGYTGFSGPSGYTGFTGVSGYSGFSGKSGYSGFSGPSLLPTTEQTASYSLVLADAETCVAMNVAGANNLTVPLNATQAFDIGAQIVIEQRGAGTTTIVATGGVTINAPTLVMGGQYSTGVLVKQGTDLWVFSTGVSGFTGYSGASGYSGFTGISGYSGFSGTPPALKLTYNTPLSQVVGTIVSKAGTVTGTAGVGSSLFLQRILIPGAMSLTEIDCALSIAFPVTSQGAGTMSRRLALYSFGNSTSLASVLTVSGTSSWNTGTSTAGASTSLTQFQGGWSSPLIQPMTFASTLVAAGEYVVGQIFDFAQASSTWTLNFYGAQAASTFLASAGTNLTSASLGALSSGGLAAVSAFQATTSGSALSSVAVAAINNYELSSNTFAGSAASAIATATSISTKSFSIIARTVFNAAAASMGVMSSGGLSAGSFIGTSGSINAVTNVAMSALNSSTLAQLTLPNFGFIGTGSTTSNFPTVFFAGIMSTGALPTAITLTSAAVTFSGSIAFQQPWFQLVGQ